MADAAPRVADGLERWFEQAGIGATVVVVGRAAGGLSQETWLIDVTTDDRVVPAVLRLPTPASGSRSILTQRRALQAVAGADQVEAPELLWFDDSDDTPFGRPFIVMSRARGTVPVGWHEIAQPRRARLGRQAMDMLAALHAIDVSDTPMGDTDASPLMDLDGLDRLFARLGPLPMTVVAAQWWLHAHRPEPEPGLVLVHGDYRMGNMVVDGGRITGVLDWEMAAPGDRLTDLAWCFIPVWEPAGVDESAMIRRYEDASGHRIDAAALHWHRCFALLRLAYYALAGTRAFDAGRSNDMRLGALRLALPIHLDRLASLVSGQPVH